ncbi:toll/interleukin-1 receptor domain-containing protein [Porphyromonas levii]|uniref:toll/interleukin-1 receptor domain-containing protein n=1 Tax=Porphyromonas levii TaxID=28114 RepID=UPI001BAB8598|nr:toll/interleukin-1 receptor domain-containing protein [Porphyromonas levii]
MSKILQGKIDEVLSYFMENGCSIGEGGYLLRGKFQKIPYEERTHYVMAINILLYNKYIYRESDFYKLDQKGFDYLYGDEEIDLIIPQLSELMDFDKIIDKGNDYIFNELWSLIGKEETALLYVKGSEYYNVIKKYIPGAFPSYSDYMQDLKEKGASTSRISWYRELFKSLDISELKLFIDDLTTTINNKLHNEGTSTESILTGDDLRIEIDDTATKTDSAKKLELQPLKIFISYAWDEYQERVHDIAEELKKAEFDVRIDKDVSYGTDLVNFMNKEIRECDRCLIFLTPKYKEKAEGAIGGVAHEGRVISREIYNNQDTTKFIPVLLCGDFFSSCPDFISGRKGFNFVETPFEKEIMKMISVLKHNKTK